MLGLAAGSQALPNAGFLGHACQLESEIQMVPRLPRKWLRCIVVSAGILMGCNHCQEHCCRCCHSNACAATDSAKPAEKMVDKAPAKRVEKLPDRMTCDKD